MTIENAKITNTSITMEDHGVLTFYITVEGAGIGVNLGGYCIGTGYLGAKEFSAENGGGLVVMMNIMNVVGVHKWEDLKAVLCAVIPKKQTAIKKYIFSVAGTAVTNQMMTV